MDLYVTSFTQWLDAGPGWDFQIGGESEGWVLNQLQNQAQAVGISNMGFTDQLPLFDPAALSIFPPHNATSFTTTNKAISADPPLSLDSENDTVSSPLPAATGRLFITEHHRNLIRGLLLGSTLRDNWKLPPLVKLNQYVTRFMACFHRHQPLFHEPSWVPSESPAAVVLAVCANGAQYCLEGQDARRLFQAAVLLATVWRRSLASRACSWTCLSWRSPRGAAGRKIYLSPCSFMVRWPSTSDRCGMGSLRCPSLRPGNNGGSGRF